MGIDKRGFEIGVEQKVAKTYIIINILRSLYKSIFPMIILLVTIVSSVTSMIFDAELDATIEPNENVITALASVSGSMLKLAIVLGIVSIYIIILVVYSLKSYQKMSYIMYDTQIVFKKGIVIKNEKRVPYNKINSVNLSAKLTDRIFSLMEVSINTAGGSSGSDVVIPGLNQQVAEAMKNDLMRRKAGVDDSSTSENISDVHSNAYSDVHADLPFQAGITPISTATSDVAHETMYGTSYGAAQGSAPQNPTYDMSFADVAFAGMFNGRFFLVIGIALGFCFQFFDDFGVYEFIGSHSDVITDNVAKFGTVVLVIGTIVVLLLIWIASIAHYILMYYGFKVTKQEDIIEVDRGLLSRKVESTAIDRIQSVVITQGPIRKLLKRVGVSVQISGSMDSSADNSSSSGAKDYSGIGDTTIHPFLKKSDVSKFLEDMIPDYSAYADEQRLKPLPKISKMRSIRRHVLFTAVPIAIILQVIAFLSTSVWHWGWPISSTTVHVIALVINIVWIAYMWFIGSLAYKGRLWAIDRATIVARKGAVVRKLIICKKNKIQHADLKQNIFQKKKNLSTILVKTASISQDRLDVYDLSYEDGLAYLEWVRPKS
ncbi:MAG: PH domain-containing protein [Clostridiales Family XIII bacterium]|jgi:putative membrane protein|nr:PH domain-containing protein [Clostridiales Family XIII bacterium]